MKMDPGEPLPPSRPPRPLRAFSRSLPMALLRAREAVMTAFRPILQAHDLTEQQWRVLRMLAEAPERQRLGAIASATCISGPSLSRLVRTLETRGVVRRDAEPDDQRAAHLILTRAGRTLVARVAPRMEAAYEALAERIGGAEMERLYAMLERTLAQIVARIDAR